MLVGSEDPPVDALNMILKKEIAVVSIENVSPLVATSPTILNGCNSLFISATSLISCIVPNACSS